MAVSILRHTVWRCPAKLRRAALRLAPVRRARRALYRPFGVRSLPVPGLGYRMRVDLEKFDQRAQLRVPYPEQYVVDHLRSVLRPGACGLDVGAYCGYFTLLMARGAGPSGRVFAFEPVPPNAAALRATLALNELPNVAVVEAAVTDTPGTVTIRVAGPASSVVGERGDPVVVEAVTIDGWAEASGLSAVDVVKLDVEGAELAALRGMASTLRIHRPQLVVEVNDPTTQREVEAWLGEAGYGTKIIGRAYHGAHLAAWPLT